MSVPSWLSRHTLMFGSVVGGFEPQVRRKSRPKTTRREASPTRTHHSRATQAASNHLEDVLVHGWEGNTLPRPACGSFLIKAPPSAR